MISQFFQGIPGMPPLLTEIYYWGGIGYINVKHQSQPGNSLTTSFKNFRAICHSSLKKCRVILLICK